MENNKTTGKEQPKPKINIPTQKTFRFNAKHTPEKIDEEINEWLEKTTRDGKPAMLGKMSCNHATGDIFYVFMFTNVKDK